MIDDVIGAARDAYANVAASVEVPELGEGPPPIGYYLAVVLQKVFCTLCGADPYTFVGGDPEIATVVIRNCENIARHHWSAGIGPRPRDALGPATAGPVETEAGRSDPPVKNTRRARSSPPARQSEER